MLFVVACCLQNNLTNDTFVWRNKETKTNEKWLIFFLFSLLPLLQYSQDFRWNLKEKNFSSFWFNVYIVYAYINAEKIFSTFFKSKFWRKKNKYPHLNEKKHRKLLLNFFFIFSMGKNPVFIQFLFVIIEVCKIEIYFSFVFHFTRFTHFISSIHFISFHFP